MSDEKRCEYCVHFRIGDFNNVGDFDPDIEWCAIDRPLIPCEQYEREVGSDDDREDEG